MRGDEPLTIALGVLSGISPVAVALALLYLTQGREGRRDYWLRVVDVRRIGLGWWAVILLLEPGITAIAALLDSLLGGSGIGLGEAERFLDQPLAIFPYILFMLFFGPIPEELGWRGYALDRLQVRRTALNASLILGVVWALWHLPMFFIEGTYQQQLGVGTWPFWRFMLGVVAGSVIHTWVFNNTDRSTLAAVLLHFIGNFEGELFALSERAETLDFGLWVMVAILVTVVWGPRTLSRAPNRKGFQ